MYRNVQNSNDDLIPQFETVKIDNQRRGHGVGKVSLFAKPRVRVGQKKLTKWEMVWRWTKSVGVLVLVALALFLAVALSESEESQFENLELKSAKLKRSLDSKYYHQSHLHEGKLFGVARKSINAILLTYPWTGSGFVGDLLTLPIDSAYLLEPSPLWSSASTNHIVSLNARELLNGLFNCHRGILRKMTTNRPFKVIRKLSPINANQTDNSVRLWRENDATLATRCSRSKFRLVETARLQVKQLIPLANDDHLKLKIIHLVRDPQSIPRTATTKSLTSNGVTQYIESKEFNQELKDYCLNVSINLKSGQDLTRKQYLLIQYEDLRKDPMAVIRRIFNFLGLSSWYPIVRDYFRKHRNGRKWKTLETSTTENPLLIKTNKECMDVISYLDQTKHSNLYKND